MVKKAAEDPLAGHPRYEKVKSLGSGAFGFVDLATDKYTNEQVAIKFIARGEAVTKYVEREILNHRSLLHPHIVQFYEVFLTKEHLGIAMEFAAGGNMYEYLMKSGAWPEDIARWFFQQLIVGIDYMHRQGVANRDIKLENTLLDGGRRPLLKLCDFGYSKHENLQSAPDTRVGTPAYLAPEVIRATGGQTYDGKKADIWSCGVMLYAMIAGAFPFDETEEEMENGRHSNKRIQRMIQRILHAKFSYPPKLVVSPECRDLLSRMLVADPLQRITIPEMLKHPWVAQNLPAGVAEMNDNLPPASTGLQSVEEIERIMLEATMIGY